MRALAAALILAAGAAGAQARAVDEAEALILRQQLAPAVKALDRAEAAAGNDRSTLLRIYELQGVALASLNKSDAAGGAFKKLLALDPEHRLSRSYPPRVMTPWYEAQAWVSGVPAMKLEQGSINRKDGRVTRVSVLLTADPLGLARTMRFHLRAEGGPWQTIDQPLDPNLSAWIEPRIADGACWVELLGAQEAVLLQLADELHPLVLQGATAPPAPAASSSETPQPAVVAARAPQAAATEPTLRPLAWGALAAAAAAGGLGVYFGVTAQSARNRFDSAERLPNGVVTGLTQREAVQLDATARTNAILGNTFFIAAGALAAASVATFVIGSTVRVAAAPGGVSVSGEMP